MSDLALVLAMGAAVFLMRLAGLSLPAVTVPAAWERALAFVPASLLAALVVISLTGSQRTGWEGIAAVAVGAAVVVWTDDVRSAFDALVADGVPALKEPHEWLGRLLIAWLADPDGNPVQVVQAG